MASIELKNVKKSYGAVDVIKGIDLSIRKGEFMVFVGPSGCGKSTLLRLISGLEDITSGDLLFDGERVNDVIPSKRGIAMVFQSYALYPHMKVYDNMAFGMKLAGSSKEDMDKRVRSAAKLLQIEHLLDRLPRQLSGGQRQRVAIGRAITRDPRVFLFDEPLSNLDAALRVATRLEIAKLHHDMSNVTMIYVTHDQVEAMTLADRIVVLQGGRIEQVGTPLELYHHPVNRFVAGFIGSPKMNFLDGEVTGTGDGWVGVRTTGSDEIRVPVRGTPSVGDRVVLGLRPEHVEMRPSEGAPLAGEVQVAERLGGETFLHVGLGDGVVLVKADGFVTAKPGTRVGLGLPAERLHLFDAEGRAFPQTERNPLLAEAG